MQASDIPDPLAESVWRRPGDPVPWRVLADWLTEHGDVRGELILTELELLTGARDGRRYADLQRWRVDTYAEHHASWGPEVPQSIQVDWFGGFPVGIVKHYELELQELDEFLAHPTCRLVGGLRLAGRGVDATWLASWPGARRLRALDSLVLTAEQLEVLARSPHLRALAWLDAEVHDLAPDHLPALSATDGFPAIHTLRVGMHAGDVPVSSLVQALSMRSIETLSVSGKAPLVAPHDGHALASVRSLTRVGAEPSLAWLEHPIARDLAKLGLNLGHYDADLPTIVKHPVLRGLSALHLTHAGVGPGAQAIAEASFAPTLRSLALVRCPIGDEGAMALARGDFPSLEHLRLAQCELGDAGAVALASVSWPRLALVDLSENDLRQAGFAAWTHVDAPLRALDLHDNRRLGQVPLEQAPSHSDLQWLDLGGTGLGDAGVEALCLGQLPRLQYLMLQHCGIGPSGARTLAHATTLDLVKLDLGGNRKMQDGLLAWALPHVQSRLRHLGLSSTDLDPECLLALCAAPALQELDVLDLGWNPDGPGLVAALLKGARPSLRRLHIEHAGLTRRAANALATTRHLPRLGQLDLDASRLEVREGTAWTRGERVPPVWELGLSDARGSPTFDLAPGIQVGWWRRSDRSSRSWSPFSTWRLLRWWSRPTPRVHQV